MNKNGTKEALIEAGLQLIHSTGYSATGINQILDNANVRSFYNHFTSKDEFVIEVIKLYAAGEQARLERVQVDSTLSPIAKLRRYFEDKIAFHGERGQFAGCLLGNLSLEVAGHNAAIRDLLRRSFDEWQQSIASTIRESIEKGELPRSAKANVLAAVIVDSWEGAQVRARTEQSDKALNLFYDCTFNVLLRTEIR
ncbi:TetR family transcriptional regulator C-terminal domain-containing protein [Silvibacterium acidisoli]|uniref:TetR family transcriptional regulator C-terminal domain-containing protein n=1 Tax=Acidobacteriaceae bacterium ZG23-2 TaxID=2883246 RepID=UPI00406C4BEB